jgi:hypothetical protein
MFAEIRQNVKSSSKVPEPYLQKMYQNYQSWEQYHRDQVHFDRTQYTDPKRWKNRITIRPLPSYNHQIFNIQ